MKIIGILILFLLIVITCFLDWCYGVNIFQYNF